MTRAPENKFAHVETVVFDLDGTLIDSSEDIADSLKSAFALIGARAIPRELVNQFVGNGVSPLIRRALEEVGRSDEETLAEALAVFRAQYRARLLDRTGLYPGAREVLEELSARGYRLGLLTNKSEEFTIPILEGLNSARFFQGAIIAGDTLTTKKPDPAGLLKIIDAHSSSASATALIGDSSIDISTARRAGALSIGALYGFRPAEEIMAERPDATIENLFELSNIFSRERSPSADPLSNVEQAG